MERYNHKKIEQKWQKKWADEKLYETPDKSSDKENYYTLVEFAYPSGNLHVGHWYAFSVPDMYARYMRMTGRNVLFPVGFDSFGLPAENAAIKRNLNPREWTYDNIEYMRDQIGTMGTMFDWSHEVITSDPEYYKWTQWLFLELFKKGLAYQEEVPVNWCLSCKTVLANEQVIAGHCERCGTEVEQRKMRQWLLRITDYADRLIDDLDKLDWPEPIKQAQRNWIGRSEGTNIKFQISNFKKEVEVFTTRPDTLFGVTYLVLAPEHKEIQNLKSQITNWDEVYRYIDISKKKSDLERQENKEKTGVELKGISAINPGSGEEIPVWIADYVLENVGTGAIMAVPAHDQRDYEFARTFGLPIMEVVVKQIGERHPQGERRDGVAGVVERDGEVLVLYNKTTGEYRIPSGGYEDDETAEDTLRREITEESGYVDFEIREYLGQVETNFYAVDKNVFRHKYHKGYRVILLSDKKEKTTFDDYEDFEVFWMSPDEAIKKTSETKSGEDEFYRRARDEEFNYYDGDGVLVNSGKFDGMYSQKAREKITKHVGGEMKTTYRLRDWLVSRQRYWGCPIPIVHCQKCGAVPVPEKDLPVELPEIEDYLPAGDGKSPLAKVDDFVRVKCPKCGDVARRETDTLDTFIDSSWYFLRYTDPKNERLFASREKMDAWLPVDFYSGGAEHTTMHLLYSRFFQKALYDLGLVKDSEPYKLRMNRGIILGPDGQKMSKSRGNVIDPDEIVKKYGADVVRMYLAFIGPYNEVGHYPWSTEGIKGLHRFLDRVWKLSSNTKEKSSESVEIQLHRTIKKVGEEIKSLKMNTAVSSLMIFLNSAEKNGISKSQFETYIKLLAPFAPHIAEELWRSLGHSSSIHLELWPEYKEDLLTGDMMTIAVQVNGKTRGQFEVAKDVSEKEIQDMVASLESIQKWTKGEAIKRFIYIPGRLVNIVLDPDSKISDGAQNNVNS